MSSNQIVYHKYNTYMYNMTIGIAQMNTFSCTRNTKYTYQMQNDNCND